MTTTSHFRLVRTCVGIQCLLGLAAALFGGVLAVFSAATANHDPEDMSGVGILLGTYLAAVAVVLTVALLLLARRAAEWRGARIGLLLLELLIAGFCLFHHPTALAATVPTLSWLAALGPAAVASAVLAIEIDPRRR